MTLKLLGPVLLGALLLICAPARSADPAAEEAHLLQAGEGLQKADAKIAVFEKTAERMRAEEKPWWQQREYKMLPLILALAVLFVVLLIIAGRNSAVMMKKARIDQLLNEELLQERPAAQQQRKRTAALLEKQTLLLARIAAAMNTKPGWRARASESRAVQDDAPTVPIALTSTQRERFQVYLDLRDYPNPKIHWARQQRISQILIRTVVFVALILLWLIGYTGWAALGLGFFIGMLGSSWYQRDTFASLWPALREVLNWKKIEASMGVAQSGKKS